MGNYIKFDSEASLREARSRLPLARVLDQYCMGPGFGPGSGEWKNFTCPFCKKKKKAGIFQHDGVEMFKCQSTSCPTGASALDAVGFISAVTTRRAVCRFLV